MEPPFRRIGIVGTGLIGGSIALAAHRVWADSVTVTGTPSRSGRLPEGLVDRTMADVAQLARESDLVVLGVPVDVMPGMMAAIRASGSGALVTDVGSTKRSVMRFARDAGLPNFVGGHPMAGGEKPGPAEARADLFDDRPWLLVGGSAGQEQAARLETFAQALGARTRWMEAEVHDRAVAYVSHLPQILAAALLNAADAAVVEDGPEIAGRAFTEMTRLASSPAAMWRGICADNEDFVREALEAFLAELPETPEVGDWIGQALSRSGEARRRWSGRRRPGE